MATMFDWESANVTVVRRADLPTLRSVVVGGREHGLGVHKDFRRSELLAQFIPDQARLAMAWVHLEAGESLEPHDHPIETMIIMCSGTGKMNGAVTTELAEGDIVAIPRGRAHGFIGTGTGGYWALSIQFEARGLYEKPGEALVQFEASKRGFDELVQRNEQLMNEHTSNDLFALVCGGEIENAAVRATLLDTIQIWSRHFQRTVMSRATFGSDPRFAALAHEHLVGEFGHDTNLAASRGGALRPVWDPILEACSAWFPSKMLSLDDAEKTVLVHLVLEGGANVFHKVAHPVMHTFQETNHFEIHAVEDENHLAMGLDALRGLDAAAYPRLERIQREGWDMLNALCARMAMLARAAHA
jgi:quercetin dioxygenase-like cupin family protein